MGTGQPGRNWIINLLSLFDELWFDFYSIYVCCVINGMFYDLSNFLRTNNPLSISLFVLFSQKSGGMVR